MRRGVGPVLALGLLSCALLSCAAGYQGEVLGGGETKLRVVLELAEDEAARSRGLRGYASLAPDQGLLLVFPGPSEVCITNEGVVFGIDAVFVEAGRVTAVETFEAEEGALRCHRADEVLELAAGVAAEVNVNDLFVWE